MNFNVYVPRIYLVVLAITIFSSCIFQVRDKEKKHTISAAKDTSRWNKHGIYGAFYSPDGKWISAGCGNGQIKIYNREDMQVHCNILLHKRPAHSTLFDSKSKWMISSSYDNSAYIFDVESCQKLEHSISVNGGIYTAIFNNSGNQYAVCGGDSTAKIFLLKNDSLLHSFVHPDIVHFIWYSDDDRYFATACEDGNARIYDTESGKLIKTLRQGSEPLYCVVIDKKNELVVTVGNDSTVTLWDFRTAKIIRKMTGHSDATFVALFSPDRKYIGSCSADHTIKLWETNTGNLIRTFYGHEGILSSLHFDPDGKELLSGSMDGSIKLWDIASGVCKTTIIVADPN